MAATASSGPVGTVARTRVLVIEDERDLTQVLTYNLQKEGYETTVAHDGQEGLRKAQTLLPDLIILDLMLPALSGTEVLRELKAGERTREIPVIILTAKSEETDQVVGFSMGCDDYVTKPFSVKVLLQRIKALQRRHDGGSDPGDVIEYLGVRIDRVRHRAFVEGRELRAGDRTRDIPILILTAKAEETDQVVGFSLGADDYVTKPFHVKVLMQRLRALQRRRDGGGEPVEAIEHLEVRIDRVRHRAYVGARELELTPTEFRLLECMLRQPGRAFTRAQLMDAAIGEGAVVLERTIDVHIKTLRKKLGDAVEYIETVRGVGYRFREGG